MRRVLGFFAGVLVLVILTGCLLAVRILTNAGYFTTLSPSFAGQCTAYDGIVGAEDLQIDRETGWVYLSATDRRRALAGEAVRGDILAMRLDAPEAGFMPLTGGQPDAFRPHGISLITLADGRKRLFAVSHPGDENHTIEIFELNDSGSTPALTHIKTIRDPLIHSPNDLVAVGPDQFYVTNDHAYEDGLERMAEDFLRLNLSTLVFYDGSEGRIVADKLTFPNGVNVSRDGLELYLTETTDGILRVYDRDPETGDLTIRALTRGRIFVGAGLDNIDVHPDGSLWIASHPKLLDFLAHAEDPDHPSPSMVSRVMLEEGPRRSVIDQVYLNLGEEISGSSIAAAHNGKMVVGSVFEPKILVCDLPDAL